MNSTPTLKLAPQGEFAAPSQGNGRPVEAVDAPRPATWYEAVHERVVRRELGRWLAWWPSPHPLKSRSLPESSPPVFSASVEGSPQM